MDILSNSDRVKLLSSNDLEVYLVLYSLCYKGAKIKSPRPISKLFIVKQLKAKGLELSYMQVRRSIDKIVKLGLIEKYTTTFGVAQDKFNKQSFFRIPLI